MASVRLVRGVDVSCGHFWFLSDEAGSFLSGACPGCSYFCRCRTGEWSDRGECESGRGSAWALWIGDESQKRHRSTTQSRHPFRSRGRWRKGHWRGFLPATTEDVVCARVLCLASFLCLRV